MDRRIKTSIVSIIADLALIGTKAALAVLSGSLAIWADFFHSASDLLVSGMVLFGILLRRRREKKEGAAPVADTDVSDPDQAGRRPGYRVEALAALVISLVILSVPYEIIMVNKRAENSLISHSWLAVAGVTFCILLSYFLSRFKIIVGRNTDSPALVADGYHSRMDMFTSVAVLLSLMAGWVGIEADRVTAVIIATLIAVTGLELLKNTILSLARRSELSLKPLGPFVDGIAGRIFGQSGWTEANRGGRAAARVSAFVGRLFSKPVLSGLALAAVLVWFGTGMAVVRPGQVGIRLCLGAIVDRDLAPGLHYHFPRPIGQLVKVDMARVHRVELGFRTDRRFSRNGSILLWDTKHQNNGYTKTAGESTILTGDENLVDFSLVVHFKPRDPVRYRFSMNGVEEIMRGVSEASLRQVLSTEQAIALLTEERARVLPLIRNHIQQKVEALGLGVETINVYCHDLHPPVEVLHAVRDVFSAREDRAKAINEAQGYHNVSLPRARAQVDETLVQARIFKEDKQIRAQGEAARFEMTALAFQTAPDITIYRLFLETAEKCLVNRQKIIADPAINNGDYRRWLFLPERKVKKAGVDRSERLPDLSGLGGQ